MAGEQPFCHPAGVTRWMTHPRAQGRLSGCRGRPPLRADRRFLRRGGGLPRPAANRSVNKNGAANSYKGPNPLHHFIPPPAGEDVNAVDR